MFPQEFPFRKCQLQDVVTQLEAEAAPRVQEAQPKEQGKAEAANPPQAVLLRWQEPKQGLQRLLQLLMPHTGTTCLKVRRPGWLQTAIKNCPRICLASYKVECAGYSRPKSQSPALN